MQAYDKVRGCSKGDKHIFKKVKKVNLQGMNRPHPIRRGKGIKGKCASPKSISQGITSGGEVRTMLKEGSMLAMKFPELYARQVNAGLRIVP